MANGASTDVSTILMDRVADWLTHSSLAGDDLETMVRGFCERLAAAGMPIARVHLSFSMLHPLYDALGFTWERGSGETLACGTGACAVCVAGVLSGRTGRSVLVHLRGGDLAIEWSDSDNHVYMTGPAVEVFNGEWRE